MIKLDSAQKKSYDKSKGKTGYKKTILANQLDEAFKKGVDNFTFSYQEKGSDLGWHPSGDCLPSVTSLWKKAHAYINNEPYAGKDLSHLNKIFMVGHYWHQVIQYLIVREEWAKPSAIENIGYYHWDEEIPTWYIQDPQEDKDLSERLQWRPFTFVRGQGDIAPLIMPDWNGLVDIKTMNPASFKQGLAQSTFANKYLAQINIYMAIFDLDQALILAVDKGSSAFAEYTFVRDQRLIDQVCAKWEFVSDCLMNDIIPTEDDNKAFELYIGDEG